MKITFPWLRRALRREDGSATIEFALLVPLIMTIFIASFESGFIMMRLNMLQHALDTTMRELRLGKLNNPSSALIKQKVCDRMALVNDCTNSILVEVKPITNWVLPSTETTCINRDSDIVPVVELNIGQQNQLMLVRVCLVQDMIFPTSGLALSLPESETTVGGDGSQGPTEVEESHDFNLVAVSAYVNEPK